MDDWRNLAACKGLDPNLFFPTTGESINQAQAVCNTCPVTVECLHASFDGNYGDVELGVWGGEGHRGRRQQRINIRGRRQQRINIRGRTPGKGNNMPKPINHGTDGGYQAHQRQKVPMCEPCREARKATRARLKQRLSVVREGDAA